MATLKLTFAQGERVKELFHTPSSELSSEQFHETVKTELEVDMEFTVFQKFLQAGFGLSLRNRPRKVIPVKVEKPKRVVKDKVFQFSFEQEDGSVNEVLVDMKANTITDAIPVQVEEDNIVETASQENIVFAFEDEETTAEVAAKTAEAIKNIFTQSPFTNFNNESTVSDADSTDTTEFSN